VGVHDAEVGHRGSSISQHIVAPSQKRHVIAIAQECLGDSSPDAGAPT
jgi:hypothetical protein